MSGDGSYPFDCSVFGLIYTQRAMPRALFQTFVGHAVAFFLLLILQFQ